MMKEYPSKSAVAICLSGVKDACDGTYINDATGTAQLLDSTKASISGSSVSFTASGSNGRSVRKMDTGNWGKAKVVFDCTGSIKGGSWK